ncbi:MAG TPA: TadE/TadG family type IV pilus assembly protein [Caulobacteraceae bacterium]|nr:TadE/TadG family type IV pilus assembly protein [Caulobacteraceae bacterium]
MERIAGGKAVSRLGDAGGLAAIEFAFIAPLLILAYFAVAELCGAMLAQRKTSHIAAAIGDLTTQYSSLKTGDMGNVFAAGQAMMAPNSTTSLKMRISVVQENAQGTAATVLWSCASSNWTALATGTPETLQPNLITANQSVVMAEARYAYSAPVSFLLPNAFNYSDVFYLRPRLVDPIPAPVC